MEHSRSIAAATLKFVTLGSAGATLLHIIVTCSLSCGTSRSR